MRTASYRVSDLQRFTVPLGFVGENEHCQIVFLAETSQLFTDIDFQENPSLSLVIQNIRIII